MGEDGRAAHGPIGSHRQPRPQSRDAPSRIYLLVCIYVFTYVETMPSSPAILEVIAEPTRRRILDVVRTGERSVGELVDELGMGQPGVSRHLRILRDAGLVEVRQDAQRRLYRLRPEPLMEIDAWLEPYRAEWQHRLDSLERHLQRTSTRIDPTTRTRTEPETEEPP